MLDEMSINTLDIYHEDKLVSSIITEAPINIKSSDEFGFQVEFGDIEVTITATKIVLK